MKNLLHNPRRAFTLVELLVVIAIIALMLAILTPALQKARDTAMTVNCLSQQRQMAVLLQAYESQYTGYWPASWASGGSTADEHDRRSWSPVLSQQMDAKPLKGYKKSYIRGTIFDCPSSNPKYWGPAYGYNAALPPPNNWSSLSIQPRVAQIKRPTETGLIADHTYVWIGWYDASHPTATVHNDDTRINLLYADLHAESLDEYTYRHTRMKGY